MLFQTTGLFQSILQAEPAPVAVNKVRFYLTCEDLQEYFLSHGFNPQVGFKLFGLLPGYIGLHGTVEPVGDADDTVKVFFEQPVLSIASNLHLRIGEEL